MFKIRPEFREQFQTKSDCEVLIYLYLHYGPDFLTKVRLNGMFAFVLYDVRESTFVVGRDPLGQVPLYYGTDDAGSVHYASEFKAFVGTLKSFTIFQPGTYHVGKSDRSAQLDIRTFYDLHKYTDLVTQDSITYKSTDLRQIVENAVIRELSKELEIAVFLSGGLNSALIAAIANRNANKNQLARIRTYTIGQKGSEHVERAEQVAKFLGTKHRTVEIDIEEALSIIDYTIFHLELFDVKSIREGILMILLMRQIHKDGVKLVLSGEGASELFGEYKYFKSAPNWREFHMESIRLLANLYKNDCPRVNKACMAQGVEGRSPFLDIELIEYIMQVHEKFKPGYISKWILRDAFNNEKEPFLPENILWGERTSIDKKSCPLVKALTSWANAKISDEQFAQANAIFPKFTPKTKEAFLYRKIFEEKIPVAKNQSQGEKNITKDYSRVKSKKTWS